MLFLNCVLGSLLFAWLTWCAFHGGRALAAALALVVAAALAIAGISLWPGILVVQKALTMFAMPVGLVWFLFAAGLALKWRVASGEWREEKETLEARSERLGKRKISFSWMGLVVAFVLYTTAGNSLVGWLLVWSLEREYCEIDATEAGAFDVVLVLGGGVTDGPAGQFQLNEAGDRLMLAARLYATGQTQRLASSGVRIAGYSTQEHDQAEISRRILGDLGVPLSDIIPVAGRNTFEEIQAISRLAGEEGWQRIGLVTSAWHMPRVMRLAGRAGLDIEPLPADFRSSDFQWREFSLVPDAGSLYETSLAVKEYLAMGVGR